MSNLNCFLFFLNFNSSSLAELSHQHLQPSSSLWLLTTQIWLQVSSQAPLMLPTQPRAQLQPQVQASSQAPRQWTANCKGECKHAFSLENAETDFNNAHIRTGWHFSVFSSVIKKCCSNLVNLPNK